MHRKISVVAVTVGLLAASVAGAAPASADHLVGIDPSGCSAGPLSFDIPTFIHTKRAQDVSLVTQADGTIVATCTFRQLPKRGFHEIVEQPWVRPPVGQVNTDFPCVLGDYDGRPFREMGEWHAESSTATWLAGSKVRTVCTFDPSIFEGFGV